MNAGLAEEGGKVAHGLIEGLKTQPLSLALVIINLVFIIFTFWLTNSLNERTTHQYEVKDQLIAKLLDQCAKGKQVIEEPEK